MAYSPTLRHLQISGDVFTAALMNAIRISETTGDIIISGTATLLASTTTSGLRLGSMEMQSYAINNEWLGSNTYFDGSVFRYRATGYIQQVYFNGSGNIALFLGSSQTAGTDATSYRVKVAEFENTAMTGGWNRVLTLTSTFPTIVFNSNSTRWGSIGYDYSSEMRFYVYGSSADTPGTALYGFAINNAGYTYSPYSSRAPIFYDSADTGYFADLASTGESIKTAGHITIGGQYISIGAGHANSDIYMGDSDEGSRRIHCNSNRVGFLDSSNNWGAFCDDTGYWQSNTSVRGPLFYDSDDTGYYCNPAGTSLMHTWQSHSNSAAWTANTTTTYGTWNLKGIRNAWTGIMFDDASDVVWMFDGSGNGGLYQESGFGWALYYNVTNACWGFGTSTTNSTYSIYANKGIYSTGQVYVTSNIYATGSIYSSYSDDRLKTRLGNIENALEKILSLSGFYYEPNETAQKLGYEKVRDVGVSAQDTQKILPEIVGEAPIGESYLTVRYEKFIPLLIEAIKELKKELDLVKNK